MSTGCATSSRLDTPSSAGSADPYVPVDLDGGIPFNPGKIPAPVPPKK
ncbi:MAG: hypothetical protein KGM43_17315 [Planctomycetota bacterium]|nr:hypothetical protein [Planctomycetota bacterium]